METNRFEIVRQECVIPVGSVAAKLVRELAFGEIERRFTILPGKPKKGCDAGGDKDQAKCLV